MLVDLGIVGAGWDLCQVRIPTCLQALSAAVTVCEDMSEWQQALQLFASKSLRLGRENEREKRETERLIRPA